MGIVDPRMFKGGNMGSAKENKQTSVTDTACGAVTEMAETMDATVEQPHSPSNRRQFLCKSARTVAYASPVVLLFRPKAAIAGSVLTEPPSPPKEEP